MEAFKKARESFSRANGSSATPSADPKVDKSSPTGDACVSDLFKINSISRSPTCVKLVDHIQQAGDLDTFSSLSLEKKKGSDSSFT